MSDELGILSLSGGDFASTTLGSWNLSPTSDTDIIPPISRLFRRNFNLCE